MESDVESEVGDASRHPSQESGGPFQVFVELKCASGLKDIEPRIEDMFVVGTAAD